MQQEPETQQEQPSIAEDFLSMLSAEDMRLAQAHSDREARRAVERARGVHDTPEEQDGQFRLYTAFVLLTGAKMAALAQRGIGVASTAGEPRDEPMADEPAAAPQPPAQPKRGPGRPRGQRAPGGPMPPPALRARPAAESAAPVPAAPRKPQPTAEEVLAHRPAKPPPRRATGGEG
ncbi:hypothetical protein WMF30_10090 [Sorangium sp. So ce134]